MFTGMTVIVMVKPVDVVIFASAKLEAGQGFLTRAEIGTVVGVA
jgi:hypothetical protein